MPLTDVYQAILDAAEMLRKPPRVRIVSGAPFVKPDEIAQFKHDGIDVFFIGDRALERISLQRQVTPTSEVDRLLGVEVEPFSLVRHLPLLRSMMLPTS